MRDYKLKTPLRRGVCMVAAIGAAGAIGAAAINASAASSAAGGASGAQSGADTYAAMVQSQMFAKVQALLKPWVDAGTQALGSAGDLIGLNGAPSQQFAINQIQQGPQFTSTQKLGENRILANASATGGLRGGNVQGALSQFNGSLLTSLIQQQYGNLQGIANNGQNAAGQTGAAALSTGNQISGLAVGQGQAVAGGILGQAQAGAGLVNSLANGAGVIAGKFLNPGAVPAGGGLVTYGNPNTAPNGLTAPGLYFGED